MLSDPHGPPTRQPCALDRARSSSPQRGPRRSLSGASSPGAPQTGAQEDSTPGARHRERPARCAQPSRPPRARAHGASPPPSAPTPGLRAPSPPRALRSNQSAAAGAGPLGGGSPTRRRRAPVPSADPGARGRRSLGPWLRR